MSGLAACHRIFVTSVFTEQVTWIGERFEFERMSEGIKEKHRRLLARFSAKTHVGFDDESHVRVFQPAGQRFPLRPFQDDAEVGNRNLMSVDRIAAHFGSLSIANIPRQLLGRTFVANELVPEEIEIDPLLIRASFGALQLLAVELPSRRHIGNRDREMEWHQ